MSPLQPFGWRTSWVAVKGGVARELAREFELVNISECGWNHGVREASGKGVFVTPPVSGWTLIVGRILPDAASETSLSSVVRLSERYGSAQYFGNHRIPDYYAWAKAEKGRLVRAYAYLGERDSVLWDRGKITDEEMELGLINVCAANESGCHHAGRSLQEYDVFAIAKKWSINPTEIEDYDVSEAFGTLGYLKPSQRNIS